MSREQLAQLILKRHPVMMFGLPFGDRDERQRRTFAFEQRPERLCTGLFLNK
ncbi:MAG: hypothetical protein WD063_11145 [Pirellulales bacterium]